MIDPAEVQSVARLLQRQYDIAVEGELIIDEVDRWFEQHVPKGLVDRRSGSFVGANTATSHHYFIVRGEALRGYERTENVVVDPVVRQFTYPVWQAGAVDTYVADSAAELPVVGVYGEDAPERRWYA